MICDIQKANWWKRFSAFLLDAILVVILSSGFCLLTSAIVDFDGKNASLQEKYDYYEQEYDVSFSLTVEEQNNLSEEEIEKYNSVQEIISKDKDFIKRYQTVVLLTILILAVGILFGVMIVEFVAPIIFKNGQTLGKKVFSLCVIRTDSVKPSIMQLFIRSFIGKYVVETMIPVLLIVLFLFGSLSGEAILGLFVLLVIQIVLYVTGKYHQYLHDRLSFTIVADKESQMIFNTYEEMIKYKQDFAEKESKAIAESSIY